MLHRLCQPALASLIPQCQLAVANAIVASPNRWLSALAQPVTNHGLHRAQVAGQPTHETHPELLGPDELAPGISAAEFEARRRALACLLPPASVALVPAASQAFVTGVIPYPYRQDADFLYLTGIQQQAVALIETSARPGGGPAGGGPDHRFILFVPQPDADRERWDGAWLGPGAARDVFGADEAYPLHEAPARVQRLAARAARVLFDFDRPGALHAHHLHGALHEAAGRGRTMPLRPLLHRMRLRKSPGELALMRASAEAAAGAMRRCMQTSHPGVREAALAATFEYECRLAGAQRMAYPPVVGGGPDACTIHYSRNDKEIGQGLAVLMDAGCELWGYCSDVTRTWPVGGRFTGAQRDVYQLVAEVRRRCLEAVRPGASLSRIHQLGVQLLSEGIHSLGLARGASLEATAAGGYREFFVHSIGHYLGLDVHDTNTVGHSEPLAPGAVLAIEPGLYVPDAPWAGAFRGIGVRLEDVVAVTPTGCEVLSAGVPTDMAAVEELVGRHAPHPQLRRARPLAFGAAEDAGTARGRTRASATAGHGDDGGR